MKHMKLIRRLINLALFTTAVVCFSIAGVKTSKSISYARQTNALTSEINETIYANQETFYVEGTEAYIRIQDLNAQREECNENYNKWENGIVPLAIAGFVSTFDLILILVNSIKREQ